VDMESGVWCVSIGHGHPRTLRVLADQSAQITHTGYNYTNPILAEAAGELLSVLGLGAGCCVFLCSGSEAVEYGVRVARHLVDRPLLLTMSDSYFGAYGAAADRHEDEWYGFDWMQCAEGCDESCEHWTGIPFHRVGGFLFEPGSSSGLVRFPPRKLIQSIARSVRDAGGLLLVNEVTTGFGRTGRFFGYQHYDLSPDVVALGKGMGNGYPVSAAAFSAPIAARLDERPLMYAQSHQNDPLGAAVAREVIRVIQDEGLIERSRELGEILLRGLEALARRTDKIEAVRGRGLMVAVELADDPEASFTTRTHRDLVRRGYLVAQRPGLNVLRIDPPLTIEREQIDGLLATLGELLAEGDAKA